MALKTSPLAKFIRTDVRISTRVPFLHSSFLDFFSLFYHRDWDRFYHCRSDKIEWLDSWRFVSNYSRVLKIKISTTGLEWWKRVGNEKTRWEKRGKRLFNETLFLLNLLSFSLRCFESSSHVRGSRSNRDVVNFRDMFRVVRSIDEIKHHPRIRRSTR